MEVEDRLKGMKSKSLFASKCEILIGLGLFCKHQDGQEVTAFSCVQIKDECFMRNNNFY